MKQEHRVQGLPDNLFNQCRNVLLQTSEFDTDTSLRAVFITDELRPFRDRLPSAASKSDRVNRCLAFLLDKRLSDGRPVLPVFLEALHNKYQQGDALRDELASLADDVEQSLEPTPAEATPHPPAERSSESVSSTPVSPSSPANRWAVLSRHPVAWVVAGVLVIVIATALFFKPLRCVLEFRLTEATVALIALLAVGASMVFKVAPTRIRTALQSFYGGFALSLIIVVVVMLFLSPPSQEDCAAPVAFPSPTRSTVTPKPALTTILPLVTATSKLSPSAVILSLSEGEQVFIRNEVRGRASNLWPDH
jgi:predicted membrane protein